jgi:hypothetical protein
MFWNAGRFVGTLAITTAVVASIVFALPPSWLTGPDERARRWKQRARLTAIGAGLLAWGLAPFWAIPTGIERYDEYDDPTFAYIGQKAYEAAWMHNDNPITRVALPAVRVRRVWRDPGHCPPNEPGGREPYADWRADARFYTYFGIPGPRLQVTCGGWAW